MNRKVVLAVTTSALLVIPVLASAQPAANPAVQDTGTTVTVPFSDPLRPGTVKVSVMSGSVTVRVGSGRDVTVATTGERESDRTHARDQSRERNGSSDDPAAGLRRLTQPAGVTVQEENNTVTIAAPFMTGSVHLAIHVPAATSLVVHAVNGGEVDVQGINGSIEVNNVNGSIRLADIGGPVSAHATNGRVVASLRQVAAGTPMAFTSFNGSVDVTVPASARANLKLRSDRGDVYTDFDVQATAPPAHVGPGGSRPDDRRGRAHDDRDQAASAPHRIEADRSIYGTINGGGADFELRTFNGDIYLRKGK